MGTSSSNPVTLGRTIRAAAVAAAALAMPISAEAGEREMSLLESYVGEWDGAAKLLGGDEPEDFTCRMTITEARTPKIYYVGRCTLVGLNLTVSGAIGFNDKTRRYEGVMSSNTAFSGIALGRIRGSSIVFDFEERQPGEQDDEVAIDAQITLKGETVTVDFSIAFSDSGETLTTSVPFGRRG